MTNIPEQLNEFFPKDLAKIILEYAQYEYIHVEDITYRPPQIYTKVCNKYALMYGFSPYENKICSNKIADGTIHVERFYEFEYNAESLRKYLVEIRNILDRNILTDEKIKTIASIDPPQYILLLEGSAQLFNGFLLTIDTHYTQSLFVSNRRMVEIRLVRYTNISLKMNYKAYKIMDKPRHQLFDILKQSEYTSLLPNELLLQITCYFAYEFIYNEHICIPWHSNKFEFKLCDKYHLTRKETNVRNIVDSSANSVDKLCPDFITKEVGSTMDIFDLEDDNDLIRKQLKEIWQKIGDCRYLTEKKIEVIISHSDCKTMKLFELRLLSQHILFLEKSSQNKAFSGFLITIVKYDKPSLIPLLFKPKKMVKIALTKYANLQLK